MTPSPHTWGEGNNEEKLFRSVPRMAKARFTPPVLEDFGSLHKISGFLGGEGDVGSPINIPISFHCVNMPHISMSNN